MVNNYELERFSDFTDKLREEGVGTLNKHNFTEVYKKIVYNEAVRQIETPEGIKKVNYRIAELIFTSLSLDDKKWIVFKEKIVMPIQTDEDNAKFENKVTEAESIHLERIKTLGFIQVFNGSAWRQEK